LIVAFPRTKEKRIGCPDPLLDAGERTDKKPKSSRNESEPGRKYFQRLKESGSAVLCALPRNECRAASPARDLLREGKGKDGSTERKTSRSCEILEVLFPLGRCFIPPSVRSFFARDSVCPSF
jgi:hypothetical protein